MRSRATGLAAGFAYLVVASQALAQPGGAAPPPPPPAPTAPAAPAAPAAATQALVLVHIDSPDPVNLEAPNADGSWSAVCHSPCDRPLPAGEYRIYGNGIRSSKSFQIEPGSRTTLEVDPTSSGGHTAGIVLTVVGGVGLLPGAAVTAAWLGGELVGVIFICPIVAAFASKADQNSAYGNCLGDISSWVGKGYSEPGVWIPAIAGTVLLTTGIVLLVKNSRTSVSQTSSGATLTMPSPFLTDQPRRLDAVGVPPPSVVRLLDVSF